MNNQKNPASVGLFQSANSPEGKHNTPAIPMMPEKNDSEATARTPRERLLRLPQVLDLVGLGKTTVYDLMKEREFPQPRKVRNLSVWVESEVQAWIESVVMTAA